jgi:hypothetical protein
MAEFIFTYHGGTKPETQEDGMKCMEEWKTWAVSLGTALTNPGTPVGVTKVLTAEGVSNDVAQNPVMGFSIIEAANMEAALELLKDCPHFDLGGTLEISEMMQMPS